MGKIEAVLQLAKGKDGEDDEIDAIVKQCKEQLTADKGLVVLEALNHDDVAFAESQLEQLKALTGENAAIKSLEEQIKSKQTVQTPTLPPVPPTPQPAPLDNVVVTEEVQQHINETEPVNTTSKGGSSPFIAFIIGILILWIWLIFMLTIF